MNLFNLKDDTTLEEITKTGCIITIISVIFFILEPIICYWGGWVFGVFAQYLVGEYIVNGFSYLNITIPQDHIPEICGALTTFGWCIRGKKSVISEKDVKK